MFEVSFTARQRKNYLFYCLMYLFQNDWNINKYCDFVAGLADKFFKDVYLVSKNLNEINTPNPGSFDNAMSVSQSGNMLVSPSQQEAAGLNPEWKLAEDPMSFAPRS